MSDPKLGLGVPAWDVNYLGASLLAKRVRNVLEQFDFRLTQIATGGVDYALLEQMVNNVLGGMNLEGLNEAQVKALIAAAIAALPPGISEADVQALIAAATAAIPPGGLSEAEVKVLIGAALAAMVMPILEGHTTDIAGVDTKLKALQTLVAGLVGDVAGLAGAAGLDEAAVIALLEEQLTAMAPMIQQAIQDNASKLGDRLTLNTSGADNGRVTIQSNNFDGAQWVVDLNLELQRDGKLFINDKRVLTVGDELIQQIIAQEVALFTALIENLYNTITGGVEQINGATGEPVSHAVVVGNWLAELAVQIANAEANVMAFGDNVALLSATKADQAEFLALKAAVAALGSGSGGAGLTGEQAQLIVKTAADLTAIITGITDIFETSPNPDGVVNVIRRLNKDAETGSKLASALVVGFLGKPVNQLGGTEQEALQAIVDWGVKLNADIAALQVGGGGGTPDLTAVLARLNALEAENVTLKAELAKKADKTALASYAKLDDNSQEITVGLLKAVGVQFTITNEVLVPIEFPDYGTRLALIPTDSQSLDDAGIVVVHTDIADLANGDVTSAQLAQALGPVTEQAAFALAETQRLQSQDEEIVEWIAETYVDKDQLTGLEDAIVNLFGGVYSQIQDFMDAINGPNATVQGIQEMFWLLSDIVTALMEATGVELPGRTATIGSEE